jgi:hypothetical protein
MLRFHCLSGFLLLTACKGGSDVPDDIRLAAEAAGHFSAGLETTTIVAGLMTEFPAEEPADVAIETAADVLDSLLGSCADVTATTGDETNLTLDFGDDGCDFLQTPLALYGAVSYQTSEDGLVSSWTITFDQLQISGVTLDGSITVTKVLGLTANFELDNLMISYDNIMIDLTSSGGLQTVDSHLEVGFSASGSFTWADQIWSLEAVDVSRQLTTDCYPESGAINVSFLDAGGADSLAVIRFIDSQLGLDSDDSGEVEVTVDGESYTVQLPERACTGF